MSKLPEIIGNKFLYFGYGSNMLEKRILINNPSAVRKTYGQLKNYEFTFFSSKSIDALSETKWKGAPATIFPKLKSFVFGAIWEIDLSTLSKLDEQESGYDALSLPIELNDGEKIICRVYQSRDLPEDLNKINNAALSLNCIPSCTYLKTIVKGAIESDIPQEYVNFLRKFKHNCNTVEELEEILDLKKFNL